MNIQEFIKSNLKVFWFYRSLLLKIVFIFTILGIILIFTLKPKYESTFAVYISPLNTTVQSLLGNTGPLSDVQTCVEVLRSEPIIGKVVNKFHYRIKQTQSRKDVSKIFEYFSIKNKIESGELNLTFDTRDVLFSYEGLQKIEARIPYGAEYEDSIFKFKIRPKEEISNSKLKKKISFKILSYGSALKGVKKRLRAQQRGVGLLYISFRDENKENAKYVADSILKWFEFLAKDLFTMPTKNTKQLIIKSIDSVKTELDKALLEIKQFQEQSGLQKATIAGSTELLNSYLSELSALQISKASAELAGVVLQVNKIDSLINALENNLKDYPDLYIKLRKLMEKISVNSEAYKSLIVKYYELSALEKQLEPVFKIMLYPQPPKKPVTPRKKITLLASILLGLFLGATISLWSYIYNPFFKDELDIKNIAGNVEIYNILDSKFRHRKEDISLSELNVLSKIREVFHDIANYLIVEKLANKTPVISTFMPLESLQETRRIAYLFAKVLSEKGYSTLFVDLAASQLPDPEIKEEISGSMKSEEIDTEFGLQIIKFTENNGKFAYSWIPSEEKYMRFISSFRQIAGADLQKVYPSKFIVVAMPAKLTKIDEKFLKENSDSNLIIVRYGKDRLSNLISYNATLKELLSQSVYLALGPHIPFL